MDGQRRGTGGKIVRVESRDIKIRNNEKLAHVVVVTVQCRELYQSVFLNTAGTAGFTT